MRQPSSQKGLADMGNNSRILMSMRSRSVVFPRGLGDGGGGRWLAQPESVKGLFDREHLRYAPDFAPAPAWALMQR